jgi:hypothetical protein
MTIKGRVLIGHSLKWYHWVLTRRNKLETNHFLKIEWFVKFLANGLFKSKYGLDVRLKISIRLLAKLVKIEKSKFFKNASRFLFKMIHIQTESIYYR